MMRNFVSAAAAILCYAGYICSVAVFCGRRLSGSRFGARLFGLLLFVGGALCDYAGRAGVVSYMIMMLSYHILLIGLTMVFFRERAEKKVFVSAFLIAVTTLVENFCVSLFSCLELFYLHAVKRIADPMLGEWESLRVVCAGLVVAALVIFGLSRYFSPVLYGKSKKWYVTLAAPLFATVLMIDAANWGAGRGVMLRSGGNMGLYRDQLFSCAGSCFLTALAMLAAGFYVFGMNWICTEQEKSAQYRMQVAAYGMLEEQYRQSERLRHDLKNHVLALSGFLEKREWDGMERYLRDMRDSAGFGNGETITGNRTVDLFLCQKQRTAENRQIAWECDAQMPPQCRIREFDLCVLLGNLLDNAIEACGRLQRDTACGGVPFIRIRIVPVRQCLLLEIKNSTSAADGQTADETAERTEKESHGIGLLNVRDVVRRYDGTMKLENADGVFGVSILIPYPDGGTAHDTEQAV